MALARRRPRLEDEFKGHDIGTYNDKPNRTSVPKEYPTYQFVPNINIPVAIEMISIMLWDYQAKGFLIANRTEDAAVESTFDMWFPFAWHTVEKNDIIKNLRNGHVYVVDEVITTDPGMAKNYLRLRGKSVPKPWHPLRWDNRRSDLVSIIPAFPDTEARPYEFTDQGHLQTVDTATWTDTITYSILREEPGSLEGKMFAQGVREMRPRFREEVNAVRYKGMWIDTEIRFDFWTKSNGTSERLREWFRDFYMKYYWLMEANGIQRIQWVWSGQVENVSRWRNDIVHRSAVYHLRTEYSSLQESYKIRSTEVAIAVKDPDQEGEVIHVNLTI